MMPAPSALMFSRNAQQERPTLPQVSLPQLRGLLNFLSDTLRTIQAETELEDQQSTEFVYLLDFDVIFDYIVPYLRNETLSNAALVDHVSVVDFFDDVNESFSIPLGTFLEISRFVQRQLAAVRHLYAASVATDLENAVDSITSYFASEKFTDIPVQGFRESLRDNEKLLNTQFEAVRLLAESEMGMRRLYFILTHPKLVNVFELIAHHPFAIPKTPYANVLSALGSIRRKTSQRMSNVIDAYNIAFADQLNRHLAQRHKSGKMSQSFFFRLLTNTKALYQITSEPAETLIRFRVPTAEGHSLDLLEGTEEALAKRIFRSLSRKTDMTKS